MMTSLHDVTATVNNVTVDVNDSNHSISYYYYDYDYTAGDLLFYYVLWTITTPIVTLARPPSSTSLYVVLSTPIVFALITLVGVVGNLFVVMVIVTRRSRRRSPTNILLLNLAIADLAFLVVCVPFTAVKYAAASWPLGVVSCRVVNYLLYVTVYVT